jgi:hypothetical protein
MLAACASKTSSGTPGIVDVGNGCKINAAQVCANIRGQPVEMSDGHTADHRMVEQNSTHTADIFVPINMPDGSEIVEVKCRINAQKQSVQDANVQVAAPMTNEREKYLRAQGYCAED